METRLLRIMALLYRQGDEEIRALQRELVAARKRAWTEALRNEARRYGYTGPVSPPRREDLAWIEHEARADAESIVATWNRDVERQLRKLYRQNPRGNRYYYAKHMEAWAARRNTWKAQQIARQNEYGTIGYAQRRFREMNGLRGGRYVFSGPPPVCGTCVGHFARGVVGQRYVDAHPTPVHIGCDHTWKLLRGSVEAPSPEELWVG